MRNRAKCLQEAQQIQYTIFYNLLKSIYTGVLISPWPDQEGNKLRRQKILIFIYPIYNHNWRNINTIVMNV